MSSEQVWETPRPTTSINPRSHPTVCNVLEPSKCLGSSQRPAGWSRTQNGHGHQNGWAAASTFLASLQSALSAGDADKAASYFNQSDSAWRDVLAMTGPGMTVSTYEGTDGIKAMLETHLPKSGFSGLQLAEGRTPPRRVKRAGKDCLECVVSFSTTHGNGFGILRLVESAGHWTGWTISLILHELHGCEEQKGQRKAGPGDYSRDFGAANWLDRRNEARAYKDRDPTVIVVGGGQAGLSAAARLSQLGLDTLIVDPEARVGDNWRNRYHSLTLHNEVHVNHLPFLPFPPTFPVFIPKDMLANWFEAYVQILELNFWTSTTLVSGGWDEKEGCWTVALERKVDGRVERRTMKPRHLVFATGVSGSPIIPDDSLLPGISSFAGTTIHSSTYVSGHQFKGKNALVIGSGNSAHDVAQDLYSSGAQVTMIQRSPTHVVSVQEAQRVYSVYTEGIPIDDCDLIALASPLKVAMEGYKMATSASKEADRELLEALEKVGFETSDGVDGTGFQPLYMTRGGGYYFNVGCSDLIASGKLRLLHAKDLAEFTASGITLQDGSQHPFDLVVFATGYTNLQTTIQKLLGDGVAEKIGPVWGFNETGELRNMFGPTAQKGLWFLGGSLAQCRIWSRVLALGVKAVEVGRA